MDAPNRAPLAFISHKQDDFAIADEVRKWIYKWSRREVKVFQSSATDAERPEAGMVLSQEIADALWAAGVVILLYTDDTEDWSWCMYECGVATNRDSPNTRVVILQCSTDQPRVFRDRVRHDARSLKDITNFVTDFLTDATFFPDAGGAVAPKLRPEHKEVETAANELYTALARVLPATPVVEWPVQPVIRLQLPAEVVRTVAETGSAGDETRQAAAFDQAAIIGMYQQASQVFRIADLPAGANFGWLADRWAKAYPAAPTVWAHDVRRQVQQAAAGGVPTLRWPSLREVDGNDRYTPVLTRVRRVPAMKSLQFDISLLPYDRLMATTALERMVRREDMVCVHLEKTPEDQLRLLSLSIQFDQHNLNRIPVLDSAGCIRLMAHRSMINAYMMRKLASGAEGAVRETTLQELFADQPDLRRLFETSFDVVSRAARLSDVQAKMAANPDCYDVFVTETGRRDEPVLGWVTDVIIAQSLGLE